MRKALEIRVFGIVQGVGFRPTVSRHAMACGVSGYVSNMGPYVEIVAQGEESQVDDFVRRIHDQPPVRASILRMDIKEMPEDPERISFEIIESEKRDGDIFVSPDIAICERCKEELYDPANRRYLHPFINCTCCGPRLTILDAMPYDRVRTSMGEFPMCDLCASEYTDPETRRYDAQPVCCNDCGPEVYILEPGGQKGIRREEAIRRTRQIIRDGGIAAIKGIGGFHLCCDATSEEAVSRLRKRKKRPMKPFAVMMKDLDTVRRECLLDPELEPILDGHQKPILLLPVKKRTRVCPSVAPENPMLGVMLPYTPLHLLLFDYHDQVEVPDCLVMTSANTSGAPICRDDEDALRELSHLCDIILSHDRLIRIRADDTVMDLAGGRPYMIRRSRGYAPLPVMTGTGYRGEVLAVGGELKNTFCIGKNDLYYPSPFIGDMTDVRTVKALGESVRRMTCLLETDPALVVCDLHPGYNSTAYAETLGKPLLKIQHHYAHILSCMAENDTTDPVIGIALDGTGYGTDGTVWGGEILLADLDGFDRFGSLDPFIQTGGDLAAREGWRIAAVMIRHIFGEERATDSIKKCELCTEKEARLLWVMAEKGINSVRSTSAGRLFDAVSALLGIRRHSTFEGEASMALQYRAMSYSQNREGPESIPDHVGQTRGIFDGKEYRMPTNSLVREILALRDQGESRDKLAWYFHRQLARMILEACLTAREKTGRNLVALSGGCYQNTLLLAMSVEMLEKEGFQVLRHAMIPPNDGGICLGQAFYGMHALQKMRKE